MATAQPEVDWQSTKTTVSERNQHMFNNSDMSDISFTCEGSDKIFYAHKYVLGTSSAVFHAMFYGDLAEKNSVIHLSDTDEESFEEFLRFIYADECNLTTGNVISVMYLSKKYIVPSLTEFVKAKLIRDITRESVLDILEQAIHFDEKDLETKCWQTIEWRANDIVGSANFVNIKQATLASLLKRNYLNVSEIDLFQAVLKWVDHQCSERGLELTTENRRSVIGDAVYDLRFIGLNQEEFAKHVSKSGLLTTDELVPIYEKINKLESPLLKWKLPEREQQPTFDPTNEKIRISRFSTFSKKMWKHKSRDDGFYGKCLVDDCDRDYLSFSVDQTALFLGVRFFSAASNLLRGCNSQYDVDLCVNVNGIRSYTRTGTYDPQTRNRSIPGFDVMFESPILVQGNDVVKMDAAIKGASSLYGHCGKSTVKRRGITVNFTDSTDKYNARTCVSKGQFHEIILSF